MAKLALTGPDAVQLATLACTRDVGRAKQGQSVYMLLLNNAAGIENDGVATVIENDKGGQLLLHTFHFINCFRASKND